MSPEHPKISWDQCLGQKNDEVPARPPLSGLKLYTNWERIDCREAAADLHTERCAIKTKNSSTTTLEMAGIVVDMKANKIAASTYEKWIH